MKIRRLLRIAAVVALLGPVALFAAGDANEFALVDKVVGARENYEQALMDLTEYYNNKGYVDKHLRAAEELDAYRTIPKLDFLQINTKVSPPASEQRSIKEADVLYEDGVMYKGYPDLFTKKQRLKKAINRFQTILEKHSLSDKSDEAAFMLGEIYSGFYFKDYKTAAGYYDQAGKINPYIEHPAFYRVAYIYYRRIPRYELAAERFRLVRQYSGNDTHKADAVDKLARMKNDGLIKK